MELSSLSLEFWKGLNCGPAQQLGAAGQARHKGGRGGHSCRLNKAVDPFLPVSHFTLAHPHSQTSSRQSSSPIQPLPRPRCRTPRICRFLLPAADCLFQPTPLTSVSLYRVSCLRQEPTRLNSYSCPVAPYPSPSNRRAFGEPSPSLVWTVGLEEKTVVGVCRVDGQRFEILERFLKSSHPRPQNSRHHHLNHLSCPRTSPARHYILPLLSPPHRNSHTTRLVHHHHQVRPTHLLPETLVLPVWSPKLDPRFRPPTLRPAPPSRPSTSPARFPCASHPEVYIKSREFN